MSKYGRSIRIFLADGTPSGLRHVEIANWTGQALACPRSRFTEMSKWEESKKKSNNKSKDSHRYS